jgi:hypothetical protein
MAQVKGGNLYTRSDGVSFNRGNGTISFPNPRHLRLMPVISDFDEKNVYDRIVQAALAKGTDLWKLSPQDLKSPTQGQ